MNHVWVGDPYGEGYCCASKSESQACCEAAGETWNNGTCGQSCTDDKPVSCQSGSDTWCCAEGNTCGATVGQCCLGGKCCEGTTYCTEECIDTDGSIICCGDYKCCTGEKYNPRTADWTIYECCPLGGVIYKSMATSGPDQLPPEDEWVFQDCCPSGKTVSEPYYQAWGEESGAWVRECK